MTKTITCDAEHFSIAMDELFKEINENVKQELSAEIPKLGTKTAKKLRKVAAQKWKGVTGQRYSSGFQSKKIKGGEVVTAEIGNKNVPGLVHLLEKGHLTLTGRRVNGIPHVSTVYDEMEPEVIETVNKAVGRALE